MKSINPHADTDRRRERNSAKEWIRGALADGPLPSKEFFQQAFDSGYSKGTIRRAADELGIHSRKTGFNGGWEMRWVEQPVVSGRGTLARAKGTGFRIVGGVSEGRRDGETEGRREGATEKRKDKTMASCASSTKPEDLEAASCAPSTEHEEFDAVNCAPSHECDELKGTNCAPSTGQSTATGDVSRRDPTNPKSNPSGLGESPKSDKQTPMREAG